MLFLVKPRPATSDRVPDQTSVMPPAREGLFANAPDSGRPLLGTACRGSGMLCPLDDQTCVCTRAAVAMCRIWTYIHCCVKWCWFRCHVASSGARTHSLTNAE